MKKELRKELKRWSKDLVTGELRGGFGEFVVRAETEGFARDVVIAVLDFEKVSGEFVFNDETIHMDYQRAVAKKEDAESCKVYYLEASDDRVPPDRKRVRVAQIAEHKRPTKTAAKKTSRKAGK